MYDIAFFLTLEARRAACLPKYKKNRPAYGFGYRRTEDGCCPLGVALRTMTGQDVDAPSHHRVASMLETSFGEGRLGEIRAAAREFIADWDGGVIKKKKLAEALGVGA